MPLPENQWVEKHTAWSPKDKEGRGLRIDG